MLNKKIIMLAILLVSLLAVSAVSAADNTTSDVGSMKNDNLDEYLNLKIDEGENSFTYECSIEIGQDNQFEDKVNITTLSSSDSDDLQDLIDKNRQKTLILDKDYEETPEIHNSLILDGNGHYIDGFNLVTRNYYDNGKVILKNINFKSITSIARNYVTIENCTFLNGFYNEIIIENGGYHDINIINCVFKGLDQIIINSKSHNVKISNCTVNSIDYPFILCGNSNSIENCVFKNFNLKGYLLKIEGNNNKVFNCNFTNIKSTQAYQVVPSNSVIYVTGRNSIIEKCNFINCYKYNDRGSAINFQECDGFVNNCKFINCSSVSYGGAMCISGNSLEVIIKNSLFIQNKANEGGAIYGGNGKIYNCTFINNVGVQSKSLFSNSDWCVFNSTFINNPIGFCNVTNCSIDNNSLYNSYLLFDLEISPIPECYARDNLTIIINTPYPFKNNFTFKLDGEIISQSISKKNYPNKMIVEDKNNKIILQILNMTAGDHILNIKYPGDSVFQKYSKEIKFNIKKLTVNVTFNLINNIKAHDDVIINVSLNKDIDNEEIYVSGTLFKVVNGKCTIVLKDVKPPLMVFSLSYEGNHIYEKFSITNKVNVSYLKTYILNNNINASYGEIVDITPYLGEDYDERCSVIELEENNKSRKTNIYPPLTGTIDIYCDNVFLKRVGIDIDGFISYFNYSFEKCNISNLNIGEHKIKYIYNGDSYFASCEKIVTLNISKANLPVNYTINNNIEGKEIAITYYIGKDATGDYDFKIPKYNIADNTITNQDIDYIYHIKEQLYNGTASIYIPKNYLTNGIYHCMFYYYGDLNYKSKNITHNLTVKIKLDSEIIPDLNNIDNDKNFVVPLPNDANGLITLSINDKEYIFSVVDGVSNISIPKLNKGEYPYRISYSGDNKYSSITKSGILSILNTHITTSIINMIYNDNKYLSITLKDSDGNSIARKEIFIDLNGIKSMITDKAGRIKISLKDFKPNTYIATITFKGSNKYLKSSTTTTVTVKKATPKLTAKAKAFKKSVKTKKYSITLKTNQNKVMKNTKLTLKVNKKTYTATTNAKGQATFKITKLTKKGTFKATITYNGSAYYNKVTKKVNIKCK